MAVDADLIRQLISRGSLGGGEPRRSDYTGIKALMLAVLEDGIRNYCGRGEGPRAEAHTWVNSDRRAPFSFIMICETLGLEPDAVRKALPRLQNDALPRRLRGNGRKHTPIAK